MVAETKNGKSENDRVPERRREREERIQGSQAAAREKRKVSAIQKDRERLEKLRYKLDCVYFVRAENNFFPWILIQPKLFRTTDLDKSI